MVACENRGRSLPSDHASRSSVDALKNVLEEVAAHNPCDGSWNHGSCLGTPRDFGVDCRAGVPDETIRHSRSLDLAWYQYRRWGSAHDWPRTGSTADKRRRWTDSHYTGVSSNWT